MLVDSSGNGWCLMDCTNLHKEIFEKDIDKNMSYTGPVISLKDCLPYVIVCTEDTIVGRVRLDDSLRSPDFLKICKPPSLMCKKI